MQFISFLSVWTVRLYFVSSVFTYHPAQTFVSHPDRYSTSLIYKAIRLYPRVTNLGPKGKQTLQPAAAAVSFYYLRHSSRLEVGSR